MASASVNILATRSGPAFHAAAPLPSNFLPGRSGPQMGDLDCMCVRLNPAETTMEIGFQSLRIEALCRSTRQALRPLRIAARCGSHPELEIALCARSRPTGTERLFQRRRAAIRIQRAWRFKHPFGRNPFQRFRKDLMPLIRAFASDRYEPTPSSALINRIRLLDMGDDDIMVETPESLRGDVFPRFFRTSSCDI